MDAAEATALLLDDSEDDSRQIQEDYDDDEDDDEAMDCMIDDHDDDHRTNNNNNKYRVLTAADIRQRLEEDVSSLSAVFSVSRESASFLLRRYHWSVARVHEGWFSSSDDDDARRVVARLEDPAAMPHAVRGLLTCGICFEDQPPGQMSSAACGHPFCRACWTAYIGTSIACGPGCLSLRCPDPSCPAAVGEKMIDTFSEDGDRRRYARYALEAYVEGSRGSTRWCPAPGCAYAVEMLGGNSGGDVRCKCAHSFCWECGEEAHRPVECETVGRWMAKNSAESENTKWILAYTKPCPKCRRSIEKNHGCMHMTCPPPCGLEFCWLCMHPLERHDQRSCTSYGGTSIVEEERRKMERAKDSLERYAHYYERWAANDKSCQMALKDLRSLQREEEEEMLNRWWGKCVADKDFISAAWLQIAECRRVLKWTYAYAYYLPEKEERKKRKECKRWFLEYVQAQAEQALERLHLCAEKELQPFLTDRHLDQDQATHFRTKLTDLTRIACDHFESLVGALESGLEGIGGRKIPPLLSEDARGGGGKEAAASSSKKKKKTKKKTKQQEVMVDGHDYKHDDDGWICDLCTFVNPVTSRTCNMCQLD